MVTRSTLVADRAASAFADYRAGDEARMAELVEAATPVMWQVARAVGLDQQLAEDAVQGAWAELVAKAGSIRDPQAVLGWLITTTRRAAIRLAQRQRRDISREEPLEPSEPDESELPDVLVVESERQRCLWHHVGELSPRCRELLRIIAFADRPDYAAISARLGMPVGSIGPTRGRCLAALRATLDADPRWSTP